MNYKVEDEIIYVPRARPRLAYYLQKLKFEGWGGWTELRLCYYIIGRKRRMKGKWVFAQYAPMMLKSHFQTIIAKARKKGWIS